MTKPSSASSTPGITTSFHGSLPNFLCAIARPRTLPGTPGARYPELVSEPSTLPSRMYIVRVAFSGAFSR